MIVERQGPQYSVLVRPAIYIAAILLAWQGAMAWFQGNPSAAPTLPQGPGILTPGQSIITGDGQQTLEQPAQAPTVVPAQVIVPAAGAPLGPTQAEIPTGTNMTAPDLLAKVGFTPEEDLYSARVLQYNFDWLYKKVNNVEVDFDGAFGAQCVDAFQQFVSITIGGKSPMPRINPAGGSDLVSDFYLNVINNKPFGWIPFHGTYNEPENNNMEMEYQILVIEDPTQLRTGDIIFWTGEHIGDKNWGHVAIFKGMRIENGQRVWTVFNENGRGFVGYKIEEWGDVIIVNNRDGSVASKSTVRGGFRILVRPKR